MSIQDLESLMWAEACEMMDKADRLHRQFFRSPVMQVRKMIWEPPVDIFETEHEVKIMIALPGVAPEQVNVLLDGNRITIRGQRRLLASETSFIRRLEIPYGQFERSLEFSAAKIEIGQREFMNGCLLITLNKI